MARRRGASVAAAMLCLAAVPAAAQTIVVERAACAALITRHVPFADVAHAPGRDVRGNPVAPADLAPSPPALAREFTFDLLVDLAPRLPRSSPLFQPQLGVGRVTIARDGGVLFNGQPLATADAAALAAACRRAPR